MTTEDQQLLITIRGVIASLPPDQEEATKELAEHFRQCIKRAGNPVGALAVALIGAEMQSEQKE